MLKFLLFPFSVLYDMATRLRNHLYNRGLKPSVRFDVPVIGVGNLTVGGTGKTPMVEYLVRLLSGRFVVATLSRGYKRTTKGFRIASTSDNAQTLGDEPIQYFRKFGSKVTISVGEERALAISLLLQESEDLQVILLDDSFQHRKVRPSFHILLCDFNRPFYSDLLLPAGRLRESAVGAERADVVVVTKCPFDAPAETLMEMEKSIRAIAEKPVFFAGISYGNPVQIGESSAPCKRDIIVVTGIANARPLLSYLEKNYRIMEHVSFADHHTYASKDIQAIVEKAKARGASIITTEKDMVKIDTPEFRNHLQSVSIFYLPITVQFLKDQSEFDEVIVGHVSGSLDKKVLQTES